MLIARVTRFAPGGGVAGEVRELAEHDVHADGVDEARPSPRSRRTAAPNRAAAARRRAITTPVRIDEGEQRAGRVRRTRAPRRRRRSIIAIAPVPCTTMSVDDVTSAPADRADHVAVEAGERVHPGEQPGGQAVGHALHAEHEPGHRVAAAALPDQAGAATAAVTTRAAASLGRRLRPTGRGPTRSARSRRSGPVPSVAVSPAVQRAHPEILQPHAPSTRAPPADRCRRRRP